MKKFTIAVFLFCMMCMGAIETSAHNSYTGGYSGASGGSTCAASCHASAAGTLTVSGIPASYFPGHSYTISVAHNGGSKIINFNASTRIGTSTSAIAGTFGTSSNVALYTSADGGVYASPHLIDTATFQWTAPASGTGAVTFYIAGMQGTSTGSSSGQSTKIKTAVAELTTAVAPAGTLQPSSAMLLLNYPNPFNPSTTIEFSTAASGPARVSIFDLDGKKVGEAYSGFAQAGKSYSVTFNAAALPSGMYFSVLESAGARLVRRMLLLK
jgi:hypothetical protein